MNSIVLCCWLAHNILWIMFCIMYYVKKWKDWKTVMYPAFGPMCTVLPCICFILPQPLVWGQGSCDIAHLFSASGALSPYYAQDSRELVQMETSLVSIHSTNKRSPSLIQPLKPIDDLLFKTFSWEDGTPTLPGLYVSLVPKTCWPSCWKRSQLV